jgi:hypothetical protein
MTNQTMDTLTHMETEQACMAYKLLLLVMVNVAL